MYSKYLIFKEIIDFLPWRAASPNDFRGILIYRKVNHTSYPEILTAYVKMSQLWNKLSYIYKFTIWAELQKKTLPLPLIEKQLRILPHLAFIVHTWFHQYHEVLYPVDG